METNPLLYLLASTLWLGVLLGGIALIIKLWLPGRREHRERIRAMELAQRVMLAKIAAESPKATPPRSSFDETICSAFDFPSMWKSGTTISIPLEGENAKQFEAAMRQIDDAVRHINDVASSMTKAPTGEGTKS